MTPLALVREVPESFTDCVTSVPAVPPLDPGKARRQHSEYRAALESGGFEVIRIPADPAYPDCPFPEDTAVAVGGKALATRPGHSSRRGEVAAVAEVLAARMPVLRMDPPARLDGGDVFRVGETVFVGLSGRTDRRGVEVLRGFAAPLRVVPVPVEGVLHLRSVVNPLDDRTLIVEEGYLDASVFEGLRIVLSSPTESHGANVVRLPNGTVLMGAGRPRSAAAVKDAGFEVRTVDVSEFGRADGGVTCLSIRLRDR